MAVSRQRAYQLRHIAQGLCFKCKQPSLARDLCAEHLEKIREYQRLHYQPKGERHGPMSNIIGREAPRA